MIMPIIYIILVAILIIYGIFVISDRQEIQRTQEKTDTDVANLKRELKIIQELHRKKLLKNSDHVEI